MLEFLLNKIAGLWASNFILKRLLQHRCFSVNIPKYLRAAFHRKPLTTFESSGFRCLIVFGIRLCKVEILHSSCIYLFHIVILRSSFPHHFRSQTKNLIFKFINARLHYLGAQLTFTLSKSTTIESIVTHQLRHQLRRSSVSTVTFEHISHLFLLFLLLTLAQVNVDWVSVIF